jgi:hypothetical protein
MKLLVLYKDVSYLENLTNELELEDFHKITEPQVADIIGKFPNRRLDVGYDEHITKSIATLVQAYRGKKSLLIAIHLDSQNAVNLINHDISLLITDEKPVNKLSDSPTYKTTFKISYPFLENQLGIIQKALSSIQ